MSETAAPPPRTLPELEPESEFFWTAGKDNVLRIQQCGDCGVYQHPPFPRCRQCNSENVVPAEVSGKGRIATYTINVQPWKPGMKVPFIFAAVELDEQPELYVMTNILMPPKEVAIGQRVTVTFEQHEDVWLPMFVPEGDAA